MLKQMNQRWTLEDLVSPKTPEHLITLTLVVLTLDSCCSFGAFCWMF
jgi:hypothetical protein